MTESSSTPTTTPAQAKPTPSTPAPVVLPKPTLPNPSEGIKTGGKSLESR